jgi:5-methylcytosine-specific restriction endonuclease McrA
VNQLDQPITLRLNSAWQVIGHTSPRCAIIALTGGEKGQRPALAMDIIFDENSEFASAIPTDWEHWVKLPIRATDAAIMSNRGPIRLPTVILNPRYSSMPMKLPRLTKQAIFAREKGVCGYSGRKLSKNEATVDHILPRARGGKDSWENLILCDKKINFAKGSRLNEEAGLKLSKKPKAPIAIPASSTITQINHPHWAYFLR